VLRTAIASPVWRGETVILTCDSLLEAVRGLPPSSSSLSVRPQRPQVCRSWPCLCATAARGHRLARLDDNREGHRRAVLVLSLEGYKR
jgi:hypothetical protein